MQEGNCSGETLFYSIARKVSMLVHEKNIAYGDSHTKCGKFLELLFPDGVPVEKYTDMLTIVRIFDKLMRVATAKDAFNESPWEDVVGYGLLARAREIEAPKKE